MDVYTTTNSEKRTWSMNSSSSTTSGEYESGEDESEPDVMDDYFEVETAWQFSLSSATSATCATSSTSSTSSNHHHYHYNTNNNNSDNNDNNNCTVLSPIANHSLVTENIIKRPDTKTRMLIAMTAVISRLIFPAVVSFYYTLIRNHKIVVDNLRRRLLPTIIAFLANSISRSLSSVQVFRPIRREPATILDVSSTQTEQSEQNDDKLEKSVTCEIIVEPMSDEEIRADVIFIHGLHGSLLKTWRQGTWKQEKMQNKIKLPKRTVNEHDNVNNLPVLTTRKRNITSPVNCPICCPNKKPTTEIANQTNNDNDNDSDSDSDSCTCQMYNTTDQTKTENNSISKCWPQDWLPQDCPGVRIIAINYTTDPYLWRPVWIKQRRRTSMEERSKEMMEHLLKINVGTRPIIWVGHSKGGLFIKQLIVTAWESQKNDVATLIENNINSDILSHPNLKGLYEQTKGIMFYSVPHRGSSLADMNLPLLRQSIELTEIKKNCPNILDLHRRFLEIYGSEEFNPEIFSFIETSLTFMSVLYLRIVSFESADPGIGMTCGVPLDHRDICKPTGRDCFVYQELANLINRVV